MDYELIPSNSTYYHNKSFLVHRVNDLNDFNVWVNWMKKMYYVSRERIIIAMGRKKVWYHFLKNGEIAWRTEHSLMCYGIQLAIILKCEDQYFGERLVRRGSVNNKKKNGSIKPRVGSKKPVASM